MNPFFSFRFDLVRSRQTSDVLMVFAATPALDSEALATVIESEIETNLVPDELMIVVREPVFGQAVDVLQNQSLSEATFARLSGRATVTLAAYDSKGKESKRKHIAGPTSRRKVAFDDFKRRALTSIFNVRHGFVESTATYHFENPSGRHTERFIRLSNILARGAEIAFIGFCTLPFVPEGASIAYLDTPSLYAVVAAINEQRISFPGTTPILADNFSSYSGLASYRFESVQDSFVLISASSSGALASQLIRDQGFEPSRIGHLLFLGEDKSGSGIVCDLRHHDRDNPEGIRTPPAVEEAGTCRMCAAGSFPIKLQGDQFEFAGPQQDALLIAKTDAPAGLSDLMERMAGKGIFGVGLGRNVSRQPRQFEISSDALVISAKFNERLDYVLRRSLPASVGHVIAMDAESVTLANTVAAFAKGEAAVVTRNALDSIPQNTRSAVVIAAAVIESGRTLLDISRDLRSIVPEAPLLYLVGFSKTNGEQRRETLSRTLIQTANPYPYEFIEIEKMVLPISTENNAWAAELRLLVDPAVAELVPPDLAGMVSERIARLRKTSEVMRGDLFVGNAPGRTLSLQPGFVFWSSAICAGQHTQADVFFTIASVLQQLRANAHRLGRTSAIKSNWFQQTLLAPGNFGRFNDDIIQASILRAAYPFEMNFGDVAAESRELGRLIRRIVEASRTARGGAAAEFLIAIATGRLRLRKEDCLDFLPVDGSESPMVAFLQRVCRARLGVSSSLGV